MGGDQRRPVRASCAQSGFEPVLDADELTQPNRDAVARLRRVLVPERQLEAGNHDQVVEAAGAIGLGLHLVEVAGEVVCLHTRARHGVIGDREHVEAGTAVEVGELADDSAPSLHVV